MRILICDDMFPSMIDTIRNPLPEDDVLVQEPPDPFHPLVRHEKAVITPHTAGVTDQSFTALGRAVADNVERLRLGEAVRNAVGPLFTGTPSFSGANMRGSLGKAVKQDVLRSVL